jgi:hypothetical protein
MDAIQVASYIFIFGLGVLAGGYIFRANPEEAKKVLDEVEEEAKGVYSKAKDKFEKK